MLQNFTEEDFYKIKSVGMGRLSPDGISVGLWGAFVYSGIMAAVSAHAVSYSKYITNPIWPLLIKISAVLLIVQLLITLFFTSEKNAFKFQKIQSVLLCIIFFKISIEFYQVYFLIREDRGAADYLTTIGLTLMLGGFVYLILSTLRSIRRVKQGAFRQGGKGLYDFKKSKGYISLPIIFAVAMIGGAIAKADDVSSIFQLLFCLFLCILLQYGIAIAWPEFFLLAYCRSRFDSFSKQRRQRKK